MQPNPDWQRHLTTAGARSDATGRITDFGDPAGEARAMREAAIVVPLTHLGIISVSGADASTFLNGQLTSDIAALSPRRAQYSSYCTPKGRVVATMLAFLANDAYWLVLPRERADSVIGRLRRFVLRAKVALRLADDALALFGVAGARAASVLAAALTVPGDRMLDVVERNATLLITLPRSRYLVACPADRFESIWQQLSSQAQPAGTNCWELQTIRSGVATVTAATEETFIPQMLALDAYAAVSFDKGCYPGQEIVARTRYLGDLKRHLYLGRSKQPLGAGDSIVDGRDGKTLGTVTNAARDEQAGWEFLAVLQRDAVSAGAALRSGDGGEIEVAAAVADLFDGSRG